MEKLRELKELREPKELKEFIVFIVYIYCERLKTKRYFFSKSFRIRFIRNKYDAFERLIVIFDRKIYFFKIF